MLPAPWSVSAFSQAWKEGAQPYCLRQLSKELGNTRLLGQWRAEYAEPELLAQVLHQVALNQTSLSHPVTAMLYGLLHKLCGWVWC